MDRRDGEEKVLFLGHSPWSADRVLREIGGGADPGDAPGCFTVVSESDGPVRVATSFASGFHYYYYLAGDRSRLVHGRTVFDVVKRAGLPWRWNPRALRSFLLVDQTLGEETMHRDVRAVPPGALLDFRPGEFTIRRGAGVAPLFGGGGTADRAAEALREATVDAGPGPVFLSLTAGHDSRMILAALLDRGVSPITATIGPAGCADRRVAERIAADLGLEHRAVDIGPDLYLKHARSAVRATGGAKGPSHWHVHLLCREGEIPENALHYLGVNGEFARTNYFDKGALALFLDNLPFDPTARFLRAKIGVRRRRAPWMNEPWCAPLLGGEPSFAEELLAGARGARGFLNRLDLLYVAERARNFGGGDLAFAAARSRAAAPLLDRRWIAAAAALDRRAKLGGRAQKRVTERLYPDLLDYPIGDGPPLRERPLRFYWLRGKQDTAYKAFDALVGRPDVREMLVESKGLDLFIGRRERIHALRGGESSAGPLLWEFLLTVHFIAEVLAEDGIPSEPPDR